MANYVAQVPAGTTGVYSYQRSYSMVVTNIYNQEPVLQVREQIVAYFPDGSYYTTTLPININSQYTDEIGATSFDMRDPTTDATTGSTMTYADGYAVFYSMVRDQQIQRDNASAPTGVTANAGNGQVTLSWEANALATTYNVYQGTTSGGEAAIPVQTGLTETTATITGLTNGTAYFFTVASVNSAWVGTPSAEVSATPATS